MKRSLKGASLVEALVASVVFLTVFLIAMDSIMNMAKSSFSAASSVALEKAVDECMEKFAAGAADSGNYSYVWGNVGILAVPYSQMNGLAEVTVTAKSKNGYTVIYRYLICRN